MGDWWGKCRVRHWCEGRSDAGWGQEECDVMWRKEGVMVKWSWII